MTTVKRISETILFRARFQAASMWRLISIVSPGWVKVNDSVNQEMITNLNKSNRAYLKNK